MNLANFFRKYTFWSQDFQLSKFGRADREYSISAARTLAAAALVSMAEILILGI